MNKKDDFSIYVLCISILITVVALGAIIVVIGQNKKEANYKTQIENVEQEYKELEIKRESEAHEYEQKIDKLQEHINELNGDVVDLQKKNDELREDNMNLRLRVDELETVDVEQVDEDAVEAEQPMKVDSAWIVKYPDAIGEMDMIDDNPKQETPTGARLTPSAGVFEFEGHTETYYNLDMSVVVQVAQSRGIAGEYWVRSDGAKMLGDYIMVAACYDVHPYGSLVNTSLGMGIVVDTGSFTSWNAGNIDIAVTW